MFYLSLADRPALKEVFSDFSHDPETKVFYTPYEIDNKILKLLFRIHMSKKINDVVDLPFKSVWKKYYRINAERIDWNLDNYLIIIDSALVWYSPDYINKLQKRGLKIILLAFNPFRLLKENKTFWNVFYRINFDLILSTFDIRDPKEHHTLQTYAVYSKYLKEPSTTGKDLFFLGMDKGRHDTIKYIQRLAEKDGLSYDFNIINFQGKEQEKSSQITYCDEVSYEQYLNKMAQAKCIIEIVQERQMGVTLRTFEAIVYNKMLITNNEHISDMPLYNPKYMKVFRKAEDLDFSFIKGETTVDYGYKNQFSPLLLKDQIKDAFLTW